MRLTALMFFFGVLSAQQFPILPAVDWRLLSLSSFFLLLLLHRYQRHRPLPFYLSHLLVFMLGLSWAAWRADIILEPQLALHLQQQNLQIQGIINSLPISKDTHLRFEFDIQRLQFEGRNYPSPGRVRLSWYARGTQKLPDVRPGERWQFNVRLKRPHSSLNPGGFDYETWLFQQRIRAVGYVRNKPAPQRLEGETFHAKHWIDRQRLALLNAQQTHFSEHPHVGFLSALSIGVRGYLSETHWKLFRATNTNHLLAISGLHIGLISGWVFFLTRWFYSYLGGRLLLYLPAFYPAAIAAWLSASLYTALAGFSLSTQRAWIMLTVFLLSRILGKHLPLAHSFALALIAVLVYDPLSVLSQGFWLSFSAVALLLYAFSSKTPPLLTWRRLLKQWQELKSFRHTGALCYFQTKRIGHITVTPQIVIFLGLMPLLLWWFGSLSAISIIANIGAIPLMGLLIVPLVLLGSICLLWWPFIGIPLLNLSLECAHYLIASLTWLQSIPGLTISLPHPPLWAVLLASVGALLLLLPHYVLMRYWGIAWYLPLLFYAPPKPKYGEFHLTLLDVDQGLSVLIQTQQHSLLYDTGTDFFGKVAVLPHLRHQGIRQLDTLLISHTDWDHIGGAQAVLRELQVNRLMSNAPAHFAQQHIQVQPCVRGQHWTWDGVNFDILHPPASYHRTSRNDHSCVLKISVRDNPRYSALLLGDIEKGAEFDLLMDKSEHLSAEVLVVPHHGSRTSSMTTFVKHINPSYALFPVGYQNRYRLPHPHVLSTYQQAHSHIFNTAEDGAISLYIGEQGVSQVQTARAQQRRYWRGR